MKPIDTDLEFIRKERYRLEVQPLVANDAFGLARLWKEGTKTPEHHLVDEVSLKKFRKSGRPADLPAKLTAREEFTLAKRPIHAVLVTRATLERLETVGVPDDVAPHRIMAKLDQSAVLDPDLQVIGIRTYDYAYFRPDGTPLLAFSFVSSTRFLEVDRQQLFTTLTERVRTHGDVTPLDGKGQPMPAFQFGTGPFHFAFRFASPREAGFEDVCGVSPSYAFEKACKTLGIYDLPRMYDDQEDAYEAGRW